MEMKVVDGVMEFGSPPPNVSKETIERVRKTSREDLQLLRSGVEPAEVAFSSTRRPCCRWRSTWACRRRNSATG